MWPAKNRAKYARDKLRYPSDGADAARAFIAPLIPPRQARPPRQSP
ncbi:hypothetical protein GGD83_003336 [Rhodoblastus sphagnicola]|nr:hypothetical protein [Rhodoblastus sphagnicola]